MKHQMFRVAKAGLVLALGLCVTSAFAVDACKEAGGHSGSGTTTRGQNNSSVTGNIGSSGYHYEIWYQGGNNSMTYYNDGTFSAEWNGSNDFLARVGLKYNSDKTHDQIGYFTADFKFTKSGSGSYSYFGIYGWSKNPLVEYYIVEDWFSKPNPSYLGEKKGEITVDGDTYDIYTYTRVNQPSIEGTSTFPQFFSVRRNARQCGHIDITAHFKKWGELGLKLGKMYEVKMLAEGGGPSTGKIDFTYFNMTDKGSADGSSSNVGTTTTTGGNNNTVTPVGGGDAGNTGANQGGNTGFDWGNMGGEGGFDWGNFDWGNMGGGETGNTGAGEGGFNWGDFNWGDFGGGNTEGGETGNLGGFTWGTNQPGGGTEALSATVFNMNAVKTFRVFGANGRYLGDIELQPGTSLKDALFAKFGKTGVYMVKAGSRTMPVKVSR